MSEADLKARLRELWKDESLTKISMCRELNIAEHVIYKWQKELCLPPRRPKPSQIPDHIRAQIEPLKRKGKTISEIARLLSIPRATVEHQLNRSKPPIKPGERAMRKCLNCSRKYDSEWAGDRICGSCKKSRAWRSGGDASTAFRQVLRGRE
jgi:hypothetical protein